MALLDHVRDSGTENAPATTIFQEICSFADAKEIKMHGVDEIDSRDGTKQTTLKSKLKEEFKVQSA